MGRAEAFYIQNNIYHSILDAISNGLSYSYTLIAIAVVREVLGFGTLLGISVMPDSFEKWVVMTMAPGAFFLLGLAIWISRALSEAEGED
jgi:Na+-transporting NADH:ubiquinone oxidoreductase subunit D